MSHYISKKQESKLWQIKINDFKEVQHLEVNDEELKKVLPRDKDLYIIRSASTRMDIGDYFFYRPINLKYEIEIRRVK